MRYVHAWRVRIEEEAYGPYHSPEQQFTTVMNYVSNNVYIAFLVHGAMVKRMCFNEETNLASLFTISHLSHIIQHEMDTMRIAHGSNRQQTD